MKALVLGLLISCVPVCFASSTPMPQAQQPKKVTQVTRVEAPVAQKKPQAKPQAKQAVQPQKTPVYAQRAPHGKKVVRHVQKKHRRPVIVERHYYYEDGQPRRVVVRKRIQEQPQVRRETHVYHQGSAPRVVRRYEYREPARVYVAPTPILSFGYTFHR